MGRLLPWLVFLTLWGLGCEILSPFQPQDSLGPLPTRLPAATPPPPGPTTEVTLFLPRRFEDDALALSPVRRSAPVTAEPARQALELLIAGPTGDERAADFQYPFSIRTRILHFERAGSVARVELDQEIAQVRGRPYSELVYWSLVYTLTEAPGIDGVTLLRDGRPLREFGYPPLPIPDVGTRAQAPAWVRPR